uniref:Uncharacterized protein n=1 Tax=Ailuropoda melanoleuca TaxID=9646 RepID=A0A7N5JH40_AILME
MASDFYLCYRVGHEGKFGQELLDRKLRYANNSRYRSGVMTRKEAYLGEHISFTLSKTGSLIDLNQPKCPEGLEVFYYLGAPDCIRLKCLFCELIEIRMCEVDGFKGV